MIEEGGGWGQRHYFVRMSLSTGNRKWAKRWGVSVARDACKHFAKMVYNNDNLRKHHKEILYSLYCYIEVLYSPSVKYNNIYKKLSKINVLFE